MNLHLTFDDGPSSKWTPAILDLLAAHDVKATFFVVGQNIAGHGQILCRAIQEGHRIGNHTWSHVRLTGLSDSQAEMELRATQHALRDATLFGAGCWRAPFFGTDERVETIARSLGLGEHVGADIVPEDCFTNDAALIAERVIEAARNTERKVSVVSLHDGIPPDGGSASCTDSRQPTVDAVRIILETLA